MKTRLISIALGLSLGLSACGGGGGEEHGEGSSGGEDLSAYEGPLGSTDVAAGQAVYEANCEGCHPGGAEGAGPAITSLAWDPAHMRHQVRVGESRMPAFGEDRIAAGDLEHLLAYLQSIGALQ